MKRRSLLKALSALAWGSYAMLANADMAADFQTAIVRDNFLTVRKLLQQGFDPNTSDERGRPAVVKAMQLDSLRVVQELLHSPKLQLNAASTTGETALMHACIKGHIDLVRAMLRMGAKVNHPGWTPLHYAASADTEHSVEIAALLLEHHAYIDAASPNQSTPLMLAAQYGSEAMVNLLLSAGADVQLKNQLGLTAVDFARRSERAFMVRLLEQAYQGSRKPAGSW